MVVSMGDQVRRGCLRVVVRGIEELSRSSPSKGGYK